MSKVPLASSIVADSPARRVSVGSAHRLVAVVSATLLTLALPRTLFAQVVVELEWLQQFGTIGPALDTAQAVDVEGRTGNSRSNAASGIVVSVLGVAPEGNTFVGNHALGNVSVDVQDGDATLPSGSTYRGTGCETSIPDGICKP